MDKEKLWKRFQEFMGYTDEELAKIRSNPKYVKMVEDTPQFRTHKIIAEVVSAHGCAAEHRVGDKFVMNGSGQLIRDECPEKMCVWAVAPLSSVVYPVWERFVEHLDPNGILFPQLSCLDVGCENGGWGQIIMKVHVEGPEEE